MLAGPATRPETPVPETVRLLMTAAAVEPARRDPASLPGADVPSGMGSDRWGRGAGSADAAERSVWTKLARRRVESAELPLSFVDGAADVSPR